MPILDLQFERDAKQEPRRNAPEALETVRTAGRCDLPGVTCDPGFYPAFPFVPVNWASELPWALVSGVPFLITAW